MKIAPNPPSGPSVWRPASGVWRPASGIWRLASAVRRLPAGVCRPASAVRRLASGVCRPASAVWRLAPPRPASVPSPLARGPSIFQSKNEHEMGFRFQCKMSMKIGKEAA